MTAFYVPNAIKFKLVSRTHLWVDVEVLIKAGTGPVLQSGYHVKRTKIFFSGGYIIRLKFTRFLRVLIPVETGALGMVLKFGESKIRLSLIRSHAMHTPGPANCSNRVN